MTNQGKLGHRSVEIGSKLGRISGIGFLRAAPSAYSKLAATARYPGNGARRSIAYGAHQDI